MARFSTHSTGSILDRGDVQFLSQERETGGTPIPPGVEFVRYTRSCGLGLRATGPQTPRIAVRAVFRARHGSGAPARPSSRLAGSARIALAGSPPTKGKRPGAAPATGFGGWSIPAPAAPAAGRKPGVRGGAAPRQPPQGTHEVWPQGVSWLDHTNSSPSQPGERPRDAPQHRARRRPPGRRGASPRPLGRTSPGHGGRRRPRRSVRRRRSLPLDRVSTLPLPLGHRRSSLSGDPTARWFLETPPSRPENGFGARRGVVRSPCLRSDPRISAHRTG